MAFKNFQFTGQDTEVCQDEEQYISQCPGWAESGECNGNAAFMTASCKKSCDFCKSSPQIKYNDTHFITTYIFNPSD